jgi:plastocyanin
MRIYVFLTLLMTLPVSLQAGAITGKVVLRGLRDSANAVVYIQKIPGKTFQPPRDPVKMDQLNIAFTPHVLPVLVGTRVAFPNSDEIRHNVFSPDEKFTLGTYPSGITRYQVFNSPGEVTLLCNVHAEMSAYIVVTETPYFAVTDAAGNYTITNVPAGRYTIVVWSERLKSQTREGVDVADVGTVPLPPIELKK